MSFHTIIIVGNLGREDLFYIYRTGRAASHFSSEKRDPIKIALLPPERKSYWK